MEWGRIGTLHGEFRTPHALEFDSQGRLWVADRGNHRLEIFDQDGNYLESRYMYGRVSGIFITDDDVFVRHRLRVGRAPARELVDRRADRTGGP